MTKLNPGDADTYLTGVTDQLAGAVARGDGEQAERIVDQVDADGYPAAAVALGRALDHTSVQDSEPDDDRFMMATAAHHHCGDLSRNQPDLAIIYGEGEDHYVGEWATGLGYVNVRFPKSTTRELTDEERNRYAGKVIETAGISRPIRFDSRESPS